MIRFIAFKPNLTAMDEHMLFGFSQSKATFHYMSVIHKTHTPFIFSSYNNSFSLGLIDYICN